MYISYYVYFYGKGMHKLMVYCPWATAVCLPFVLQHVVRN
jgi:hypothetical protein